LIVNIVNVSCKRHDQLAQCHHDNLVQRLENDDMLRGEGETRKLIYQEPGILDGDHTIKPYVIFNSCGLLS